MNWPLVRRVPEVEAPAGESGCSLVDTSQSAVTLLWNKITKKRISQPGGLRHCIVVQKGPFPPILNLF